MEPYLVILKGKGFKITPLRKAILDVFQKKRATLTAEKLCGQVRRRIPNAGLQSVYRNLSDFTKVGITEEIFLEKRTAAYALCNGVFTHHHHAVCRRCGRSEELRACGLDVVSRAMEKSFRKLKREKGFQIKRHFLQLEGLCHACQKE